MSPESTSPSSTPGKREALLAWIRRPAALAAALALAFVAWQLIETRVRLSGIEQELARRFTEGDAATREARALARQNQENLLALQSKVGALEARLAEAQGQQLALEAMYQELSRSRDERLVAEIEQAVSIAAQQLQLSGNVQGALIALDGADARLARAGRPQLMPLRKLINRDVERLKALPAADVPGLAMRIEGVLAAVDTLPLAFERRPRPEPQPRPPKSPMHPGFWQGIAEDFWAEFRQLIHVERIDRPDPALLSPSQSFFLRENLKLRLMGARLSLLSRDGRSFREDIRHAEAWLERYFDGQAKPVQAARSTLKGLAKADVAQELPTLDETLTALRNFKVAREGAQGK